MATARRWTDEEEHFLADHYAAHSNAELSAMMAERGWDRTPQAINTHANVMRDRFDACRKANVPWNKGRPGYRQRKKRLGAPNTRPLLSTFRRSDDGKWMIKVSPRNAVGKCSREDWISLGKFVWMQANGRDWPDGHACVFADRDPDNLDPENVVPVPIELMPMLFGANRQSIRWYDRATLEVAMAAVQLARERYRHERPDMAGVRRRSPAKADMD